ncbi:cupin domain-containing protein [Paraburkholderia sp. JHI869]
MVMVKLRTFALAGVLAGCSLPCVWAQAQEHAQTQTIKPVKLSKADLAGAVFNRKDAQKSVEGGTQMTDVVGYTSPDKAYQTGVFKSGPSHEVIKGPEGLAYTEFLYFISGGVKLTSSDGSVLNVGTGEAVTLPKGWTGQFDTQGYTKLYVTYSPGDAKQ